MTGVQTCALPISDELARLFPQIRLIRNKTNCGFAGGNNIGMRIALENGADYVWLLNNDTVVEKSSLSELVLAGEKKPRLGLLSPVIYYYNQPDKIQFCGSFFNMDKFQMDYAQGLDDVRLLSDNDNMNLWGTALLIKREVIETIGYFNESYFAYWEDSEYSFKAIKAGFTGMVALSSVIRHNVEFVSNTDIRKKGDHYYYYFIRNKYKFFMENSSGMNRIKYVRVFLKKVMYYVLLYKKNNYITGVNSLLDGVYAAFINKGGSYESRAKMPAFVKQLILSHPYFWKYFFDGDIKHIVSDNLERFVRRVARKVQ